MSKLLYSYVSNTYDHRLKIILTFRCNYKCSYCALNYKLWTDRKRECRERTPDEWANAINKIHGHGIVFNGGEPTQYPGLIELINKIRDDIHISLYTNMSFDIEEMIKHTSCKLGFLLSYHPQAGTVRQFMERLRIIQRCKRFDYVLHGVSMNKERDDDIRAKFKLRGIDIRLERDCNDELKEWLPEEYRLNPKKVRCTFKNYVFGPDGSRYPCACHLYRLDGPMENICNGDELGPETTTVDCDKFGWCHLADVKENITVVER